MKRFVRTISCVLGLGLFAVGPAEAQDRPVTFEKIADTDTLVPPENAEAFFGFFRPSIDRGNVAFLGSNASLESGIYRWVDGVLIEIADKSTPLPDSVGPPKIIGGFDGFPSIDGETVMLVASDQATGLKGIYTGDGGPLMVVVDPDTPDPAGIGTFSSPLGFPSRDDGMTAFVAFTEALANFGVYKANSDGTFTVIADSNTQIPGGTPGGTFNALEGVSTDQGNVAFTGAGGSPGSFDEAGVFKWVDGTPVVVADRNTLIPGTSITFDGFGVSSNLRAAIGGRDVAFVGSKVSPRFFGVVAEIDGVLEIVVEEGMPTPDGLSIFIGFNIVSIDNGNVAFNTIRDPVKGIYVKPAGGDVIKIIDTNDLLDGKDIESFRFGHEALSGNEIAFGVDFVDGSRGIYVAAFGAQPPACDVKVDQVIDFSSGSYSTVEPGADNVYTEKGCTFATPVAAGQHFDSGPNGFFPGKGILVFHEAASNSVNNVITLTCGGAPFDLSSFDLVSDDAVLARNPVINSPMIVTASDGSTLTTPLGTPPGFVGPVDPGWSDITEATFDIDGISTAQGNTIMGSVTLATCQESLGGALTGTFTAFAACFNVTTGEIAPATVNPDNASWDCEAAGLAFIPGDTVAVIGAGGVLGTDPVGGSMTGAAPSGALCDNLTLNQQVFTPVAAGETSWDCEAAGLAVNPGNIVRVIGVGTAE